jgi:hypothetical protein
VKRSLVLAVALVVASTSGCNSLADINAPLDKDPEGTVPVGDAGGSGVSVDRFLGTWRSTTGTQSLSNCSFAGTASNVSLALVLGATDQPGVIEWGPEAAPGCRLQSSVQGDTATLVPEQGCKLTFTDGQVHTYEYAAPTTFTLTATGQANVRISAAVLFQPSGEICNFQESAVYSKQ